MKDIIGYYYVSDCGDGSLAVHFYKDKEACDLAVAAEEQAYGYVMDNTTTLYQEDFE